jgi:hypothetical protein
MDIGRQQRIIQVEPEPITTPVEAPAEPTPEPAPMPDRDEVPAGA